MSVLPSGAVAFGGGYTYEYHQVILDPLPGVPEVRGEFPVHRVSIIDTGGGFAAILGNIGNVGAYVNEYGVGELTLLKYTPPSAGLRVLLEYAWMEQDVDVQQAGSPRMKEASEYSEFRFAVGAMFPFPLWYIDFNIIDIITRELSLGSRGRVDKAAWNLDFEIGPRLGPFRAGAFLEVDLISAVDVGFGGEADTGSALGLAGHIDYGPLILNVRWRDYTLVTGAGGHLNPATNAHGKALTIGGTVEFRGF